MKNSVKFILAAAFLILAASCTKENFVESTQSDAKLVTIQLNTVAEEAASDDTKSYVSGNDIYWELGDSIAVYTAATDSIPYCFKATAVDGIKATFSGEVPAATNDIVAVFPYPAAAIKGYDGTSLKVTLPTSQVVGEHTTAREALVAVAKGTVTSALSFKNVFGLVKVNVKQNNVQAINVKGNGLAGTVKVNAETGVVTESVSLSSNATVSSATAMSQSDYYIAVLPGTTESGKFEVGVASGESAIAGVPCVSFATPAKAVTVTRNKKLTFDTDNAAFTSSCFGIGTAAQLEAWNNAYAQWTATDKIEFYDDIDATAIENWTGHDFAGTLDGKGHAIKNFKIENAKGNACFINNLYGDGFVQNLAMGVTTSDSGHIYATALDDQNNAKASIFSTISGKAHIENITNNIKSLVYSNQKEGEVEKPIEGAATAIASGIAAEVTSTYGAVFKSCINNNTIATNHVKATVSLISGGIAGLVNSSETVKFESCINNGTSKNTTNGGVEECSSENGACVGGIVGKVSTPAIFSYCENHGLIADQSPSKWVKAGGIAGSVTANTTFDHCSNSAIVKEATGTGAVYCMVAGICGMTKDCTNTFNSCTNAGEIFMNKAQGMAIIGGITAKASGTDSYTDCINSGKLYSVARHENTLSIGGIIGRNTDSVISLLRCTNSADSIYQSNRAQYKAYLGGIIGYTSSTPAISYCINNSTVGNLNSLSTGYYIRCGGILGRSDGDDSTEWTIDNCTNNGKIYNTGNSNTSNAVQLGGIVGSTESGKLTISNCTNKGEINNKSNQAGQLFLGGILGMANGNIFSGTSKISSCICNCTIANTNAKAGECKAAHIACFGTGDSNTCQINDCGLAGTINGIEIIKENFSEYISVGATPVTSGNYYYTGE